MANDRRQLNATTRIFWALLISILLARLLTLPLYPLIGTTEPRYAELARKMLESGDWVTLWVSDGVPLWGKPPLAFWTEALSMAVFGINEWGARFAPFCVSLALLSLFWCWYQPVWQKQALSWQHCISSLLAALIYVSTPMGFLATGFVATDVHLTLGLTLSMVGFWRSVIVQTPRDGLHKTPVTVWHWAFFIGIAIGLLSKGPLSVVLLGLAMVLWILPSPQVRLGLTWRSLPWLRGTLLALVLTLPWYWMAEVRTPGFLQHFIIGEHIERFLVKGWNGGRFAASHAEEVGTIWWFFIKSFVPWTLLIPVALLGPWTQPAYRRAVWRYVSNSEVQYLVSWILASLLLFTLSRNILEAYVLPTLPAFAILLANGIRHWMERRPAWRWSMLLALILPVVVLVVVFFYNENLEKQSQRHLLRNWQKDTPLIYVDKVPPSAIFYASNRVIRIDTLTTVERYLRDNPQATNASVVMDVAQFDALPAQQQALWRSVERYDDYVMLRLGSPNPRSTQ
jgi:4-amino-4-deoxy-L-arabinose transferase-like glycosyltransferase